MSSTLPKSVAIVGAGAAGLFAARRLTQLGVKNITLLEKEDHVGGKCSTYIDNSPLHLQTERGAVLIAPNYGAVLDAMIENNVQATEVLTADLSNFELLKKFRTASFTEKAKLSVGVGRELWRFSCAVKKYNKARNRLEPLPEELLLPFAEYAKKYKMNTLLQVLKYMVTAFGYGAMEECPTYSILEYMGYTTLPCMMASRSFEQIGALSIQNGYQSLMESIAKSYQIMKSVQIDQINRNEDSITITYKNQNGGCETLNVDTLVLAISPLYWSTLFPDGLTSIEQECVDNLSYYRYPVAVCRLKGKTPCFLPQGLEKESYGHVALISTRDTRVDPKDGRLCTAYINVPPGKNDFTIEKAKKIIFDDLSQIPGITNIEILEVKIWEDYFSSLPWGIRLKLEQNQFAPSTRTLYVGPYTLGSFEDVACIANRATEVIDRCFHAPKSRLRSCKDECKRFYYYMRRMEK